MSCQKQLYTVIEESFNLKLYCRLISELVYCSIIYLLVMFHSYVNILPITCRVRSRDRFIFANFTISLQVQVQTIVFKLKQICMKRRKTNMICMSKDLYFQCPAWLIYSPAFRNSFSDAKKKN